MTGEEGTNTTRVFALFDTDDEVAPRELLDRKDVEDAKALIMRYIDNDGVTNIDTVYSDPSSPGDLDLYQAVQELLDEGLIEGPALASCRTHEEMEYRGTDKTTAGVG
jgi:predicted aldo/keto reductase-like oxidoreductase